MKIYWWEIGPIIVNETLLGLMLQTGLIYSVTYPQSLRIQSERESETDFKWYNL